MVDFQNKKIKAVSSTFQCRPRYTGIAMNSFVLTDSDGLEAIEFDLREIKTSGRKM